MKTIFNSFIIWLIVFSVKQTHAQSTAPLKPAVSLWDGMVVAGYVNKGAYLNFGGPAIKWTKKPYSISIGMLPSLRFKEDKVAPEAKKNSLVTPSLGAGISACFKHLAIQVPFYYNPKTASADGKWSAGVGLGYKF